ncbi:major facilitator transporter [Fructilactobacillus fructivorans]|uniref:DHA2 family efflux MFS transporter permease subunit n=1 Tax=Fructilactobacillus fructivorans TaxID=1614 RepID=UPI000704A331|nr:DHA2 family efflux MFS transporter permease subunit [Fructilactobacillus fructivorans]KRN12665.1 major facilitator transporter [Fructilactobacillus fructivorans]
MAKSNGLSRLERFWFITIMLIGTFTMSISQSSLSTAYPTLMKYFDISASSVQWLTTGFMIIMCIMMPISPWLLNNMSFKKLFMGVLLMFDLGTLIILISNSFAWVLFGRALEAIAVGILFPSYQTVLLNITPEDDRGTIMGVAGLVMGSALACGPIISGIVLRFTTWRGLFDVFIVIITAVFLISFFVMKDVMPRIKSKLDWISIIYSFGLIGILYVISEIAKPNNNYGLLLLILVVSIILIALFVVRQFRISNPLLNLNVLKTFNYDLAVLLTGFSYISLIVVTIIFPLYYQQVLNVSPFISGMALVPGAVFLSILNPITGTIVDKIGFKPVMLTGMIMIVLGWAVLAFFPIYNIWAMMIIAMLIEGGNAFVMMPAVTLGADSLPEDLISYGTALITTVRQVLGSTGVAVATIVLVRATGFFKLSMPAMPAQVNGFHMVYWVFLVIAVVGLIFAVMIRTPKKDQK